MVELTLRPMNDGDLPFLPSANANWGDELEFFGFRPTNDFDRWYAESGCLDLDAGLLIVDLDGAMVGRLTWHLVEYGPGQTSSAARIGAAMLPEERGKGYGSRAQRLLADYLFETTLVNRVEAGTDVTNIAEQRALEKAGFVRDGVMRGAQYRNGTWHDIALYSRLRSDP